LGKDAFRETYVRGRSATTIVRDKWSVQISDEREMAAFIEQALKENPHKVDKYGKGKEQLCGFLSAR